jgi:hypothetical protein
VIDAGSAALEQGRNHYDLQFDGEAREGLGGWARDGFGQIEEPRIFFAAKILRAVQFLQAYDLRTLCCRFTHAPFGLSQIFVGIAPTGHLDQADGEFRIAHWFHCMIVTFRMIKRAFAGLLCAAALCRSAVPTPKEHFGFTPGDDYKLASYSQISAISKLVQSSDRIRVVPYGTTLLGKPMIVAFISTARIPKNWIATAVSRRLALGEPGNRSARAGRRRQSRGVDRFRAALPPVAPRASPELAYRMITGRPPNSEPSGRT